MFAFFKMPFILVFNKSPVILKLCAQTDYMVLEGFFLNMFQVKEFLY